MLDREKTLVFAQWSFQKTPAQHGQTLPHQYRGNPHLLYAHQECRLFEKPQAQTTHHPD
jgi:hypothetical protein